MSRHTRRSEVIDAADPTFGKAVADHFRNLDEKFRQPWSTITPAIEGIRQRWRDVQAGLPNWESDFDNYNRYFIERETEAWYLLLAVKYIAAAERAIAAGQHGEALQFAFEVGDLICEYNLKAEWGQLAEQGEKAQADRARGAAARRRHSAAARVDAVARRLAANPNKRQAFRLVAVELGCSESVVRRDYYDAKKVSQPEDGTLL